MPDINFTMTRDLFDKSFTLGQLYKDGVFFAFTCEDADRRLEDGGTKIKGESAIPRGYYRLTVSESARFRRVMPLITPVPNFSGVRIHGGNTHEDTEGCPLIGVIRTSNGVKQCADAVARLIELIQETEAAGAKCWLTVE